MVDGYTSDSPDLILDDEGVRKLSDDFNLPYIEMEYALKGERQSTAMELLQWIDKEEWRLREKYGVIDGRKKYRPVKLLKEIAKESGLGRYKCT